MKKLLLATALVVFTWNFASAQTVDGKVDAGEYAHSKSVLDGAGTLSWTLDADGGLSVAVSAKTKGWVGVGFGSDKMDGSYIYFGFIDENGKAVFTEQEGKGHRHADSGKVTADKSAVTSVDGTTTIEFHVPAAQLPFSGTDVSYIVASGGSANLKAYHGGSREVGKLSLK
jgi:hypothetical protein